MYCQNCGRRWTAREPAAGVELCCAACGGPLGTRAPDVRPPRRDPFRGRTLAGARLGACVALSPGRLVYRARHLRLRTDVRFELFPEPSDTERAGRLREMFRLAALTRELRSLYVVHVLDIGRLPSGFFIITDLAPDSLRSLLARRGRLPLNEVLAMVEQVLRGLEAVEGLGVPHGNVTPDGILLEYDGSARLDRLGNILRPEDLDRLTLTPEGLIRGPAHYAPPELAGGEGRADARSDLYSLGATIYEMVSGRPPFVAPNARDVALLHATSPVPELEEAPPALRRFIRHLMAKDPADRPSGAAAALEELRQCAVEMSRAGRLRPIPAPEPGPVLKRAPWTLMWTLVATGLFVLAVLPMGILYYQHRQAPAAAKRAEGIGPPGVLVLVPRTDAIGGDPLPEGRRAAVAALLAYRVRQRAPLRAILGAEGEPPIKADAARQAARAAGADCALLAQHRGGLDRRDWTLTLLGAGKVPWGVRARCAIERNASGDLGPLAAAAERVLSDAAEHLSLPPPHAAARQPNWDAAAWEHMAEALSAERAGQWQRAADAAERALASAPGSQPFLLMFALCNAVRTVHRAGRFPTTAGLPREGLTPELAGLAELLPVLGQADEAAIERGFGDYLARFPSSARGYFLLGMWLTHCRRDAEAAAVAFRHAVDLDPDYMPAPLAYLELLAKERPERVAPFLSTYRQKTRDKENAYRLELRAEDLLRAAG